MNTLIVERGNPNDPTDEAIKIVGIREEPTKARPWQPNECENCHGEKDRPLCERGMPGWMVYDIHSHEYGDPEDRVLATYCDACLDVARERFPALFEDDGSDNIE